MAQWLRAHPPLEEDPGSIPSTLLAVYNCYSSSGGPDALFRPPWTPHVHGAHLCRSNPYNAKKILKLK